MSYTMWPIRSIGFNILNGNYIQAVIKDIENNVEVVNNKYQKELFSALKDIYKDLEDKSPDSFIDVIVCEYFGDYQSYDWYENYIEITPIGKDGKVTNIDSQFLSDGFSGYEFSFGSISIFEPEFKNLEELWKFIEEEIYIPTNYDPFERGNIVCLSGVCGG